MGIFLCVLPSFLHSLISSNIFFPSACHRFPGAAVDTVIVCASMTLHVMFARSSKLFLFFFFRLISVRCATPSPGFAAVADPIVSAVSVSLRIKARQKLIAAKRHRFPLGGKH